MIRMIAAVSCWLSVTFSLTLLVLLARFNRMTRDDYVFARAVQVHGFWGAQGFWYRGWTGRVVYIFVVSAVHLLGPRMAQIAPIVVYGIWYLVAVWCAHLLACKLHWRHTWMYALLLASVIIYSAVVANTSMGEVVWWESGVLTYPPGLIGVTAMGAVLLTDWPDKTKSIAAAVLAFISGGFAEVMVSTEIGLLLVCIGLAFIFPSGPLARVRRPLCAAFLGAALIFAIAFAAPGNSHRTAVEGATHTPILIAAARSLRFSLGHFARYIYLNGAGALLAFTAGALIGTERPVLVRPFDFSFKRAMQVVGFFAAAWVVTSAYYAPMVFVYGAGGSTGRWTLVVDFFMAIYATVFGYEVGRNLPQIATRWSTVSVVMLAFVMLILSIRPALNGVNLICHENARAAAMASNFDAQQRRLAAQAANGATDVNVGYYVFWDQVDDAEARNPNSVYNMDVAEYYGFKRVVGR
jgi:hypothetical protein